MKFEELLDLEFCDRSGIVSKEHIVRLLPETPLDVIEQFYSDHGRKSEFQEIYKGIDLSKIHWESVNLHAIDLIKCKYNPEYSHWFEIVKNKSSTISESNWNRLDSRREVTDFWRKYCTWKRQPILLENIEFINNGKLWLVEGHTRLAALTGLVQAAVIKKDSQHKIWLGKYQSA